jgi:hypothetical protein
MMLDDTSMSLLPGSTECFRSMCFAGISTITDGMSRRLVCLVCGLLWLNT